MLSLSIHRQLATVVTDVNALLDSVNEGAAGSEIALRTDAAIKNLDELGSMIGNERSGPFASARRHLGWLGKRHSEDKPQLAESDVRDLRDRDLPGVIEAVGEWGSRPFDPGLVAATGASWDAQNYDSAVLDAFIYLEEVLRELGNIDRSKGMSGDRLVSIVLGSNSPDRVILRPDGFLGNLTTGETEGFYGLVKGAFLMFRNSTAHRPIPYTAHEADDVIHLINLCLRILPERDETTTP